MVEIHPIESLQNESVRARIQDPPGWISVYNYSPGQKFAMPVDEVCRLTAGSVGKIWKARRRHLPPDVKKLMAELLLACKSYSLPDTLDEAMCAETFPEAV